MNENQLDALLRRMAEAAPELGESLTNSVRTEISRSRLKIGAKASWLAELSGLFRQPRMAICVLALTTGVGVGVALSSAGPNDKTFGRAMGIDAFSSVAPTLPSTLITQIHE